MTNPGDSDEWWKQYGGTESRAPQPPDTPAAPPPGLEVPIPPPAAGPPPSPPPSPPLPPPPYPPGPQGYPGYQPYTYGAPQPNTNGLAVGSLIASVIGLCTCFGLIVGIILGIAALRQIREKGEKGRGLALAGLWIGVVGIVLWLVYLVIEILVVYHHR